MTAAGLYAVVPYFLVHDSIGLFEPLVTALALLALVLQLRLAEEPRLDLALLLGITLGAGLLAKERTEQLRCAVIGPFSGATQSSVLSPQHSPID